MSVLVTGYTGFIGTSLSRYSNHQCIIGLDINESNLVNQHFDWNQLPPYNDINCIIHLAGKAHDTKNSIVPEEYFKVNLGLTQVIFNYFLASQAEKFIFFSSVKAVADTTKGETLYEHNVPNPNTPYGQSKLAAERYILEQKLPLGKKVYILRPCMIHGPGNKGNLNLLYNIVKKGIPYPLGDFHNLRSFTSIENLIFIIRELIERDIEPGTYQVADDEPVSTNEIVEFISTSLNRKPRIWNVHKGIVKGLAKTGDFMGLPLNSERLKKLTESYVVSNIKLKSALGINIMPVSARDGLRHTFDSFS